MRRGLIRAAVGGPAAIVGGFLLRLTRRRAGLVLVYHHVVPDPRAGPVGPVHVTSRHYLTAQMRHLRRFYRVDSAREIVAAAGRRRCGRRFPVAVTFDDDLPSHPQTALPILLGVGLPATFFVGGRGLRPLPELWWETLERGLSAGLAGELAGELGLEPTDERTAGWAMADRLLELRPDEREAWRRRLEARLGEPPERSGLTRSQLHVLVEAGCELGFHTLRHEDLRQLDDEELTRALSEGRDGLEQVAGRGLTAIAYPYGRADERVVQAARRHGFEFGFTGRQEAVAPTTDPMRIGRVEPASRSASDFALELVRHLASDGPRG